MESRRCATHSNELVQTGPSLILKFNEAWSTLDQLNGGCGASPPLPLVLLDFEYLPLTQVYTFFRWRLYRLCTAFQSLNKYVFIIFSDSCFHCSITCIYHHTIINKVFCFVYQIVHVFQRSNATNNECSAAM